MAQRAKKLSAPPKSLSGRDFFRLNVMPYKSASEAASLRKSSLVQISSIKPSSNARVPYQCSPVDTPSTSI